MLNRTVMLLAVAALMSAGCKVPGFAEMDEKISTVTERIDDLEEVAENVSEIDLSGMNDRLEALELALGGGSAQGGQAAGAVAALDSLQAGMTEMQQMLESGRDSLSAAYELIESSTATIDSLEERIDDLEGEVASLHSSQSSGVTSGASRGSTGGSSGRSGGTTGGSSSGRSGGTGGTSGGSTRSGIAPVDPTADRIRPEPSGSGRTPSSPVRRCRIQIRMRLPGYSKTILQCFFLPTRRSSEPSRTLEGSMPPSGFTTGEPPAVRPFCLASLLTSVRLGQRPEETKRSV